MRLPSRYLRLTLVVPVLIAAEILMVRAARTYTSERLVYEGEQLIRSGKYIEARQMAMAGARMEPLNPVAYITIGTSEFVRKNHASAVDAFRQSLATVGHVPNVLQLLGQSEYFLEKYEQSAKTLESYNVMVPEPTVTPEFIQFIRAQSLYRTDRHGVAAVAFARAEQHEQYRNEVLQSRMVNAILMNQHLFAGFVYRRLRHLYPSQPIDAQQLFSNALALGKTGSAITFLESVARRGDADAPVLKMLALAYVRQQNPDAAISSLHVALSMAPNDSEIYMMLGDVHRVKGETQLMRQHYERHLQMSPDSPYRKDIEKKLK